MSAFVSTSNQILVGALDATSVLNKLTFGPLKLATQDATTFADGGFTVTKPSLFSGEASLEGFQDYATSAISVTLTPSTLGSQYPITVVPNPTGTVTAGDACHMARGFITELPRDFTVGQMAGGQLKVAYDTRFPFGYVAHPSAARTTDANGTAVALVGPTAAQKLVVALHVTAYSGLTNVVFKIQSDDNSGFSSATDRITFATVSGTTSEWATVAGDFSTETHHRITWTVTGSGSVTFTAAFGVI